jgi:CubicO group peptidase (beta-lactamase class C family)
MPSFVRLLAASCAAVLVAACGSTPDGAGTPTSAFDGATADAVMRIVDSVRRESHLRAVIVRVTKDGREILTRAVGDSMTGVPATPAMHFRNGAVAISYVSTLLLRLADQGRIGLDDRLSTWLPDVPHANRVTLRQLAQMTSGYPDYVLGNAAFDDASYADPFRQWTPDELLDFAVSRPLLYEPGTNWNYAHTNYVLLGLALERATGQDMPTLLKEQVLGPLGLTDTVGSFTPDIPAPVLHAFSS